jgi:hypothetical protein
VPEERLKALVNPNEPKPIDLTEPAIAEGHTKAGKQKTTVTTTVKPPPPKIVEASETAFAKSYPDDGYWRRRKLTEDEIFLEDKDGFQFKAKCDEGTLDITVVTEFDPVLDPQFAEAFPQLKVKTHSERMYAGALIEKTYAHFAAVGNPVKRLEGSWAWANYRAAKKVYDAAIAAGIPEDKAVKDAIKGGLTFKYHAKQGFDQVTWARHRPELNPPLFNFVINKLQKGE